MRVGDRVRYIGQGWMGIAIQEDNPEGAVVAHVFEDGIPIIHWPNRGGSMLVGNAEDVEVVGDTLEELWKVPCHGA